MNTNGNTYNEAAFSAGDDAMETRLWLYIDGLSQESPVIEKLIAENAAWRAKYAELLDVHQLIQATDLEEPSLRFTKNVMEEIARLQITPSARKYINHHIIWGIAIFFITVIAGFLVYGFSQVDWKTGSSEGSGDGFNLTAVDYSAMFNNTFVNLFMMLNVILGLMLLDRFLSAKRKQFMQNSGRF